jgi:hypothetical protein
MVVVFGLLPSSRSSFTKKEGRDGTKNVDIGRKTKTDRKLTVFREPNRKYTKIIDIGRIEDGQNDTCD